MNDNEIVDTDVIYILKTLRVMWKHDKLITKEQYTTLVLRLFSFCTGVDYRE